MGEDEPWRPNDLGKRVVELAKRFGQPLFPITIPPSPRHGDTPDAWRKTCREILICYANNPDRRPKGPPKNPSQLRNEIMEDFDKFDENGIRDETKDRLSRQLFTHWYNTGKGLDEEKFYFIDRFVRNIQLTEWYAKAFSGIVDRRSALYASTIKDLYAPRLSLDDAKFASTIHRLQTSLFHLRVRRGTFPDDSVPNNYRENTLQTDTYSIFAYFGEVTNGICDFSTYYLFDDRLLDDVSIHNAVGYHGYFIPQSFIDSESNPNGKWHEIWGTAKLIRRSYVGSREKVSSSSSFLAINVFDEYLNFYSSPDHNISMMIQSMPTSQFRPFGIESTGITREFFNLLHKGYLLW
jgi:hypothetical protein